MTGSKSLEATGSKAGATPTFKYFIWLGLGFYFARLVDHFFDSKSVLDSDNWQ